MYVCMYVCMYVWMDGWTGILGIHLPIGFSYDHTILQWTSPTNLSRRKAGISILCRFLCRLFHTDSRHSGHCMGSDWTCCTHIWSNRGHQGLQWPHESESVTRVSALPVHNSCHIAWHYPVQVFSYRYQAFKALHGICLAYLITYLPETDYLFYWWFSIN